MFINRDYASVSVPKGMVTEASGYTINIVAIQSVMNSLVLPTQISICIPQVKSIPSPSSEVLAFKADNNRRGNRRAIAGFGMLFIFILFIILPENLRLFLILGGVGLAYLFISSLVLSAPVEKKYSDIAERIRTRVKFLQDNAPVAKVSETKREIIARLDEFNRLVSDYKNIEPEYNSVRRQQQLDAHLSSFTIRGARIGKLKSGDVASLASFGFSTAYDAKRRDVQSAIGIGPVKAASIASWVRTIEAKFLFQVNYTSADQQAIQQKRNNIISRQQGCADGLNALVEKFKQEAKAFTDWTGDKDNELNTLVGELAQAEADLKFLGLPVPGIGPIPTSSPYGARQSNQTTNSSRYAASTSPSTNQTATGAPSCPRCGSAMRYRVAGRGSRAGNPFWGCSRYPSCKGTRNI